MREEDVPMENAELRAVAGNGKDVEMGTTEPDLQHQGKFCLYFV